MSAPGILLDLTMIDVSMTKSICSVSLILSVDLALVPTSIYGTPQTLSIPPLPVPIYEYGILRSRAKSSSILPY